MSARDVELRGYSSVTCVFLLFWEFSYKELIKIKKIMNNEYE